MIIKKWRKQVKKNILGRESWWDIGIGGKGGVKGGVQGFEKSVLRQKKSYI